MQKRSQKLLLMEFRKCERDECGFLMAYVVSIFPELYSYDNVSPKASVHHILCCRKEDICDLESLWGQYHVTKQQHQQQQLKQRHR